MFSQIFEENRPVERTSFRWEANIKMNIAEIDIEDVDGFMS